MQRAEGGLRGLGFRVPCRVPFKGSRVLGFLFKGIYTGLGFISCLHKPKMHLNMNYKQVECQQSCWVSMSVFTCLSALL